MPTSRILALVAAGDLLSGVVLTVLGLVGDIEVLTIIGLVLLLSGGGMLAWVASSRGRPQAL